VQSFDNPSAGSGERSGQVCRRDGVIEVFEDEFWHGVFPYYFSYLQIPAKAQVHVGDLPSRPSAQYTVNTKGTFEIRNLRPVVSEVEPFAIPNPQSAIPNLW
jgi:hypothetical protein